MVHNSQSEERTNTTKAVKNTHEHSYTYTKSIICKKEYCIYKEKSELNRRQTFTL